jgi:ribosomal protein RSM22 (predicted rRNA methylase)
MHEGYERGRGSESASDLELFWLSYLAARLPASFAATQAALAQISAPLRESCESLLDLGAGPGTAIWAAQSLCPNLKTALAVERDPKAVVLGRELAAASGLSVEFKNQDLESFLKAPVAADLLIVAYAVIEMGLASLERLLPLAKKLLLIVEPGTPKGFATILAARKRFPGLVAPCPQRGSCPLEAAPESKWCHFSVRLERSRLMKLIKGGDLGYEDEKFSYAAFRLLAGQEALQTRVLSRPRRGERDFSFEVCAADGIQKLSVGKRQKEKFRAARALAWGDIWEA